MGSGEREKETVSAPDRCGPHPSSASRQLSKEELPLVSCIMITSDRSAYCHRAIACYQAQTYPRKELVVVDDGEQDLSTLFQNLSPGEWSYIRLKRNPGLYLGGLRNIGLEHAKGEYLIQWDDDDWYHPARIEKQLQALREGFDACTLSATLVHIDNGPLTGRPFIGRIRQGVPGTIMHRRAEALRYPNDPEGKGEDTAFLKHWLDRKYTLLPGSESHLFIRCFHSGNTWPEKHFYRRLRNTLPGLLSFIKSKYVQRDIFRHRNFLLTSVQKDAFQMFIHDSKRFNLL